MTEEAEAELVSRAARLAREGEREGAGWALYRAAAMAYEREQSELTETRARAALDIVRGMARLRLEGSVDLLLSEVYADAGELTSAAARSVRAERAFQAAQDEAGFIAVWTARALRALSAGNPDGVAVVRWILPRVDVVGSHNARVWLRLNAASFIEARGDSVDALEWATDVMELCSPGSGEQVVAASIAIRGLMVLGELEAATDLGAGVLARPADRSPVELRAELYLLCAAALRAQGQDELAALMADRARGYSSAGIRAARRDYVAGRHALAPPDET